MGRYIGPVEKLERREAVSLDLKGERQLLGKTSLERRAPGVYGQQLREAQKLKIADGIREKQMRRLVDRARRNHETTAGEALLQLLERRLDIASAVLADEQVVQIKPGSPIEPVVREAADDIGRLVAWLQVEHEALVGR